MIKRFKLDSENLIYDYFLSPVDPEIIHEIVERIIYGVSEDLQEVVLFEIESYGEIHTFSVKKEMWKKSLSKCLEKMIEFEDYETCQNIKKTLDLIQ